MDVKKLNEALSRILNESESFETILNQAIERISTGNSTKEDTRIIKDLNAALKTNIELSAKIYQVVLNSDNEAITKLLNATKGSITYRKYGVDDLSNKSSEQIIQELKPRLAEVVKKHIEGKLIELDDDEPPSVLNVEIRSSKDNTWCAMDIRTSFRDSTWLYIGARCLSDNTIRISFTGSWISHVLPDYMKEYKTSNISDEYEIEFSNIDACIQKIDQICKDIADTNF